MTIVVPGIIVLLDEAFIPDTFVDTSMITFSFLLRVSFAWIEFILFSLPSIERFQSR